MRLRLFAAAAALLATGTSCIEGPFEPFAPERDQPPIRFVGGAAPLEPFVWLAGVARTDSTVRLELRLRNAPRVTALAFELVVEGNVAVLDTIIPGTFFQPVDQVPLVNLAPDPDTPGRFIGVATVPDLALASAGTGTIATLVIRRTTTAPFDVAVAFDTLTSQAFGPGGDPIPMNWTRGRLIQVPRASPSIRAAD